MPRLVLLRHGESIWNMENRFTGWTDIDLSEKGIGEALGAGTLLRENGFTFDIAYTSVLRRAIRTLWIVLDEMDLMWIPVQRTWRLNERHYGALQGLNKTETTERHSREAVHRWRRNYNVRPPALSNTDPRNACHERKYLGLSEPDIPLTESLEDTVKRFLPYWHGTIASALRAGQNPVIVAHGNSLRALIKHIDNISDRDIADLNIPTGVPLIYELDENLIPQEHHYLEG